MRGLSSHIIFFPNELNKFNNTKARMLNSKYQMILQVLKTRVFGMMPTFILRNYICKPLVVCRF